MQYNDQESGTESGSGGSAGESGKRSQPPAACLAAAGRLFWKTDGWAMNGDRERKGWVRVDKAKRLLALVGVAGIFLTACGGPVSQDGSGAPASGAGSQAVLENRYEGPLYEISYTKVTDFLPEFQSFQRSCSSNSGYNGIELMTHFTDRDTITIGDYRYCDGDLNYLSVGEGRTFEAYYNGYRMFRWIPQNSEDPIMDQVVEVYDEEMNLVSTTADRFGRPGSGCEQIYLQTGWMPVTERATGLEGFFNVYTQEWRPLASASESLRGGGGEISLEMSQSFYSDGLAYVTATGFSREYYSVTGLKVYEREVLGFLDESGQYAFRFDELPDFDGLLVNMVSGFWDGTCVVAARYDDGRAQAPSSAGENGTVFYQVDFFFLIDKTGKVLDRADIDVFNAKQEQILLGSGQIGEQDKKRNWSFYAESIQVADGLTLAVENPLRAGEIKTLSEVGGYTLTDANGTQYPLGQYEVQWVIVTDDGRIFLYQNNRLDGYSGAPDMPDPVDAELPVGEGAVYQVEYEWIAPADYTVPEQQQADLTGEGLPNYGEVSDLTTYGHFGIMDLSPENDPVFELAVSCESVGYGDDAGTVHAQEAAQRTYSPTEADYETLMVGEDYIGTVIQLETVYRMTDPHFLDEGTQQVCLWSGSCSWTDENGQPQSQEINGME